MSSRCGTFTGYGLHRARKEPTCQPCRDAWREYQKARLAAAPECRVKVCTNSAVAKGLCGNHREREVRNGDPEIYARDPERNFWSRVVTGPVPDYAPELGRCWLWTGKKTKAGYGTFRLSQQYVHRYAYEYMRAPIPEGLTIDHLCRVTLCVNPDHLEPVPMPENVRREMAARKELQHV